MQEHTGGEDRRRGAVGEWKNMAVGDGDVLNIGGAKFKLKEYQPPPKKACVYPESDPQSLCGIYNRVMSLLDRKPRVGYDISDLAMLMGTTLQTIDVVVEELESEGKIGSAINPADGKRVYYV